MRRIRTMAVGLLVAALLAGIVAAVLATTASAPTGTKAASMVEYALLQ